MPKISLSDAVLRSLPAPEAGQLDYWDSVLTSFGVRVSQGGSKTFILNVSNSRRTIGRYPVLSLAEARTEAKRMLAEKTLGKLRPQPLSFPQAVKMFLEEKRNVRRTNTVFAYEYYLDRDFNFTGQLANVSHGEIVRRLDHIKKPASYNHALAAARGFFNWCQKRRYNHRQSRHGHFRAPDQVPRTGAGRRGAKTHLDGVRGLFQPSARIVPQDCETSHSDRPAPQRSGSAPG